MTHNMKLHKRPFDMIKCGEKIFELRLFDEKRRAIQADDEIEFTCSSDNSRKLLCRVLKLHVFDTFKELYESLPLDRCGYTESELPSASYKDMGEYYPQEMQMKYKVVAIELEIK